MTHSTATRRLVKSPPELWAELSSEESLGRHLAPFGEIRITRVEPETTVAWEGDRASGTVELAPTGWGTKVILTAKPTAVPPDRPPAVADDVQAAAPAPPQPPPDRIALRPPPDPEPAQPPPAPRRGFLARLFRRRPSAPASPSAGIPEPPLPDPSPPAPMPDPSPVPPAPDPAPPDPAPTLPEPQIEVLDPGRTAAILDEVLDDLGAAHHRPFSRD